MKTIDHDLSHYPQENGKTRIQELETANELKDNEVLRALKASSKKRSPKSVDNHPDTSTLAENQMEQSSVPRHIDSSERSSAKQTENICSDSFTGSHLARDAEHVSPEKERRDFILIDDDIPQSPVPVHNTTTEAVADIRPINIAGFSELKSCSTNTNAASEGDPKPMFNIRREESPSPLPRSDQGNTCFAGGILGPDGTKWHLGKWCKRNKMNGSTTNSGIYNVGSDGRGGRIKIVRSMDRPSFDDKENSGFTKRPKTAPKTSNSQSQGSLQIEHFFGKASR